jgi:hypothetical protein
MLYGLTEPVYLCYCMRYRLLLIYTVLILAAHLTMAQQPIALLTQDTALLRIFEGQDELVWVRQYTGLLDDTYAMTANLGFDGYRVRGYLAYPSSPTRIRLDGTLLHDSLQLEERGPQDLLCGLWHGRLLDNQLLVDWRTPDGQRGARIELEHTHTAPVDNFWLNRYVARWNGSWVELALMRSARGALTGSLYVESEQITVPLKGEISPDGQFLLETPLPNGEASVELSGQFRYLQAAKATYHTTNGELRTFALQLRDNMLTARMEYSDYQTAIDVVYPQTRCTDCNNSLQRQLDTWVRAVRASAAASGQTNTPPYRHTQRASGWTEVVYWDDRILSGFVLCQQSWADSTGRGVAFTFDLEEERPMDVRSLFVKNFDLDSWLAEYVRHEVPKIPGYTHRPAFRHWLDEGGFPLVCMAREGLCLSTYFHPVFGQQRMIVPWAALQAHLKKSFVAEKLDGP